MRVLGKRLFLLACAVGVSFAFIYVEMTTKLFFSLNAPRQVGDPCQDLIRPTKTTDRGAVWSNFGHCSVDTPRDPDREILYVDLRYGIFPCRQDRARADDSAPVAVDARPERNLDRFSRAFGTGGSHSYDIGLVGEAAQSPPSSTW